MAVKLILLALEIAIVYGGIPISYPNTKNKDMGGKIVPYNMIDVYPSCYERGLCPMFPPGGKLSAFPNSEEKTQNTFHNMFRIFANCTLELKWGKWKYGANTKGGLTHWCDGCKYCGDGKTDKAPLYWYSDANQAARFKQYDEHTCNQSYYSQDGVTAHHTCGMVLPEYGGGSRCDLFDGCEFGERASAFCVEDGCWFDTEGICAANSCYTDGHCEPIFGARWDYQGAGYVEGMNGADTVYVRFTKEIFYLLPTGTHFDERIKIAPEDLHTEGKYMSLMLEYFDHNETQKPAVCYSLYDGEAHEMEVAVSWNGNGTQCNGFSKDSWSVMFISNHLPPEMTCEPYAFICRTTLGNIARLPEEGQYYFGTEWLDWEWSDYEGNYNLKCRENHYYYDGTEWIVNGGPEINKCDIWFYNDPEYSECVGCSKIAKLDCLSQCIYSDTLGTNACQCNNIVGQDLGNELCSPSPTLDPLENGNTYAPTPKPTYKRYTHAPTLPTTTGSPTPKPSRNPLAEGVTYAPTLDPTPKPSRNPLGYGQTWAPTKEPTHVTGAESAEIPEETGTSMGVIAAGVIIGLLCVLCCAAWVYFRKHTNKPLYPTKSDLVLPGFGLPKSTGTNPTIVDQMRRQLSGEPAARRAQSIQCAEDSDEGDTASVTALRPPPPRNTPPPPPPPPPNAVPVQGLPKVDLGTYSDKDNGEEFNEKSPLSKSDGNQTNMPYPVQNDNSGFRSIAAVKGMSGGDKEKYLSDTDFVSVFGIEKNEFFKLPKWKQKNLKKQHGFF